ncbi:MAG TPA: class I adenylate-forming enzyme family protein [Thermoanaerobaculia bacterium]|nr:class I adenylate-forming enzyme family protein [Thermoanaerobaculia bacterium]
MDTTLAERFARRRRSAPDAIAVRCEGRSATVRDLDLLARRLEFELAELRLAPGALVGLAAVNGPGFLAALLALRRLELVALLLDTSARHEETQRLCRRLRPAALVAVRRVWPEPGSRGFELRALGGGAEVPWTRPDDAVVKLTSGSTGEPRGIATPEVALLADEDALARSMELLEDERILGGIPWSHSYGLSSAALPVLARDAVAVVPAPGDPLGALRALRGHGVTFLPTVPAWLRGLLRSETRPELPQSLRLVVTAGAPLEPATARAFRERYGLPVHVFYGASECGGIAYDRSGAAGEQGHLGSPVEGVEIEIEGAAGAGSIGRVVVRSRSVARSYVPEGDAALSGGVFRTADLGRIHGGCLRLVGRVDSVINVKGRKVQPSEIEDVLLQCPGVEEAVAVGFQNGRSEGIRAVVTLNPGLERSPGVEEILAFCRGRLADFKVPRSLHIVDALPRTTRGKLDRPALLELAAGR